MSPAGEHAAIARFCAGLPPAPGVQEGPGDDAACLDLAPPLLVSVDTLVEGVHARFDWSSPEDVGWKAVTAALSDLAAARAAPRGVLVSLAVPGAELAPGRRADGVMAGVRGACASFDAPLVGGDTVSTSGPVVIAVTVLGRSDAPLLRAGARPGDQLQVSGPLGFAGFAVRELLAGRTPPPQALAAHRRPRPRLDLLDVLADATAGLDVSDGLLADAAHLARRSGVDLLIDRAAVCALGPPGAPELALSGGEDYELVVTAPELLPGFHRIGRVEAGAGILRWSDGSPVPAAGRGWDHGEQGG